jgi:hypothetical protein
MEEALRFNAVEPASAEADAEAPPRCEHALELLLTHRGNPLAEVDQVLADHPHYLFGHYLRAALIVCSDAAAARSSLAASVASRPTSRFQEIWIKLSRIRDGSFRAPSMLPDSNGRGPGRPPRGNGIAESKIL